MTLEEVRQHHLKKLDEEWAALRSCVASTGWTNPDWKPYKEALVKVQSRLDSILRLNEVIDEASK